jgi:hypothetical protein
MSKAGFSHFVANGVGPNKNPIVELSIAPSIIHILADMRTATYLTPDGARDVADLLYRAAAAAEEKVAKYTPDLLGDLVRSRKQNG